MQVRAWFFACVLGGVLAGCRPGAVPAPVEVPFENSDQAVIDQLTGLLAEARQEPRSARARAVLGMAYEMSGRQNAALESYSQAALLDPEEPRWPYLAAAIQAELGDLEGALRILDRAIALEAGYAPAYLSRGQWLLDLGRVEEAGQAFTRASELDRGESAAWTGIAKVHLRAGRPAEALQILERLIRDDPEAPHLNQLAGQAYREVGALDRARAVLARAKPGKAPRWPDPWRDERSNYKTGFGAGMMKASELLRKGKIADALELMEQLRLERPGDRQLLNNLSVAYRQNRQPERAFEVLRDGLERHPDYFPFHLNISSDYQRKGDLDKALLHLERVLEITPTLARAWERVGSIHFGKGDLPRALEAFDEAARHSPGSTSYLIYGGIILGRMGRWDESVERLARVLEIDPNLSAVHVSLAQALAETGRFDDAREALSKARAMRADPKAIMKVEERLAALGAAGR